MDESTATWDSLGSTPPPPAAAEPAPDATPAPAEPATLEKPADTQPAAEPIAARESVSEPSLTEPPKEQSKEEAKPADDFQAQPDDPPEVAAQNTTAQKLWARRQFQDAKPLRDFLNFDKPIAEFVDDLNKRSPSRFVEMADDLIVGYGDYLSEKMFGLKKADVQARLQGAQPESTTDATPNELPASDNEVKLADENKTLKTQLDELTKRLDAVTGEITNQKQAGRQAEIQTKQQELYNDVWSVVDEGIRNLGLDAQPNDPPKLAHLKKAAAKLLDRYNVEAAFDANPENQNLVKYVYEATNRGEFDNAFRERDNLKVRARAALSSVTDSDEFKAIMEQIEAYANQSKTSTREVNPVPPVPGSTAGITTKPPSTWDEAISQSQTRVAS